MNNLFRFLTRACMFAGILLVAVSCKDSDEFFSDNNQNPADNEANTFDFSTTRGIDLIVDYSDFKIYGPVFFSVYDVNPIVNEGSGLEYVDESIEPLFSGYTDEKGKFDATVSFPAYVKALHVVTGNFIIGLRRSMAEVVNGVAKAVVSNPGAIAQTRGMYKAPDVGTATNDISKLHNLNYMINSDGSKNEKVYKDWVTPLGTWNSATGRPNYLLEKNAENIAKGLVLSDEDMNGLYKAACEALNSGTECKETYRAGADMTIIEDTEVSITALGSMTCWNSSLGYYYYNEKNIPKKPEDLNIIMLFPNTQDGQRDLSWNYQNNIGTVRGDVVQLMYYPNIANNSDTTGATKIFPKGTKIGFILKPNSWSMLGDTYCSIKNGGSKWNKKMNIWASSTEGLSFANASVLGQKFNKPNLNGEARTAKFAYVNKNGQKFAIISMEDACDDKDYDDLLFALNPAKSFNDLPEVQLRETIIHGIYAFEDLWPSRGDYDMNDVIVDFNHRMEFLSGKVLKEAFTLTTYNNTVTLQDGLAFKLKPKVKPSLVVIKRKEPYQDYYKDHYCTKIEDDVYYLTDNVKKQLGYTYVITVVYSEAQPLSKLAEYEPFIWRKLDNGKQWEMHLPFCKPTKNVDDSLFGTQDDKSVPSEGKYYVRNSVYPFAFYLANAKASNFTNTILKEGVNKPISTFYPEFLLWSTSNGSKNPDWYLHPKE